MDPVSTSSGMPPPLPTEAFTRGSVCWTIVSGAGALPIELITAPLLAVLLDESLRHAQPVAAADLRGWLAGFTGASAAAKAAKALLALGNP